MRLAIVGAGKMALWHLRAYQKMGGVEIVALANPSSDSSRLRKKFDIANHYFDVFQMIDHEKIDAIDICTPTASHFEIVSYALKKGIYVYCEKPLAQNLRDVQELLSLSVAKGNKLFSGFNYRFLPEMKKIKSLITTGELGEIKYIRIFRSTKVNNDSFLLKKDASLVWEFQSHFIDLLNDWGFKNPQTLKKTQQKVYNWDIPYDFCSIELNFGDNGPLVHSTVSVAFPGFASEILILGSKKSLKLKYGSVRLIENKNDWRLWDLGCEFLKDMMQFSFKAFCNPFNESCRTFVQYVQGPHEIKGNDSLWETYRVIDQLEHLGQEKS